MRFYNLVFCMCMLMLTIHIVHCILLYMYFVFSANYACMCTVHVLGILSHFEISFCLCYEWLATKYETKTTFPHTTPLQLVLLLSNPLPHSLYNNIMTHTMLSEDHNHFVYIIIKHICIQIHKCNLWTNTHTKWCTAISTWLMQLMTFNVFLMH